METPIPGMLVAGVADGHGGSFVSDIIKMEMGGVVKRVFSDIRISSYPFSSSVESIKTDRIKEYLSEKVKSLYHELDDIVYNCIVFLLVLL